MFWKGLYNKNTLESNLQLEYIGEGFIIGMYC